MELICQTHGANVRRVNPLRRYARRKQLGAIGLRERNMRPAKLPKLRGDLRTDLIAAFPDAWSDSGVKVSRFRAELPVHGFYRSVRNARNSTAPSCMHGGDSAMALVDQQNRHAIGGPDSDDRAGPVFEERVALSQNSAAAFGGDAIGGVNLLEGGEIGEPGWNIAPARAETVDEPRERIELADAIDLPGILIEHGYAGFCTCAMRICFLKSSSMDSSSRTSVGRLTSVVIWSILSCNFSRP
jgi:hypothetical protein